MIKGLPEDGDVRNTVLFKSVAPYIKAITINQLIYELMIVKEGWERDGQPAFLAAFDSKDLNNAFTWRRTQQAHAFWSHLHKDFQRNKGLL